MRKVYFLLIAVLTACGTGTSYIAADLRADGPNGNSLVACKAFYASLDHAVDAAGVRDAQWHIVAGYPFLRTNRFLAAYSRTPMTKQDFQHWIDRMKDLDLKARYIEIQNLRSAPNVPSELNAQDATELFNTVRDCNARLRNALSNDPQAAKQLREQISVPDDYQTWKRILGLYTVTGQIVRMKIESHQKKILSVFRRPLHQLTSYGLLTRYLPKQKEIQLDEESIGTLMTQLSSKPLGIPEPNPDTLEQLFAHFAPVLEVDMSGDYDRIGAVTLDPQNKPRIAFDRPVLYTYHSFTHYRGNVLLQLNYTFWFSERPPQRRTDLLSGVLDGITYRITLAASGRPLMIDTIHNCGCYHMFFPAENFRTHTASMHLPEPPLVPQRTPYANSLQRLVLRISSQNHQIQRLYPDMPGKGMDYVLLDYDLLRTLPAANDKTKSLFDSRGWVAGTERGERFLLWPMGVPNPGAMRQQGHHATAFLGRRHFDDPYLLEKLFTPN